MLIGGTVAAPIAACALAFRHGQELGFKWYLQSSDFSELQDGPNSGESGYPEIGL
jgi:hypothetical protein